ncbi:MAG: hypothetical protein QNJ17_04640 [Desulfocapsaceae bacterium]|nr:hypothetical protein [Desulfocapsaceae bacterium]
MTKTTLPLSKFTLEDLLPHRDNMLLVKEVVEVDNNHAVTLCQPSRSWPMAEEKGVPALILVELAAQTAGVCNGWDRVQSRGRDSEKMGWLVGIKKAEFHIDYLPYDKVITASAQNTHNFGNLREVTCKLHYGDKLIATLILQLYQA